MIKKIVASAVLKVVDDDRLNSLEFGLLFDFGYARISPELKISFVVGGAEISRYFLLKPFDCFFV
ncbi:MAG: hypothetical protein WC905_03890 [Patescibacteria group bacterium]|jgi:hypothetical protein